MNVQRCNYMKAYKLTTKEKDHELDVAMKDADLESTKALGNNITTKEAKILAICQGREAVRR